jgi:hypothetical protein
MTRRKMRPAIKATLKPAIALLLALTGTAQAAPPAQVDLALVMAVDVSESVTEDEYVLQHEGIARAFEDPQIQSAIGGGSHGAIEVAVMEWSDRDKQIVTVDWTRVGDAAGARSFAAAVRASQRSSHGLTAIGDALLMAKTLLDRAPAAADRRMIDLSGDGMANIGPPVQTVRDALVGAGITINGLAILASEPWLSDYYNQYVIGGTGAFLIEAENFASFDNAMRSKLLGEVAGTPSPPGGGKRG